VFEDEARQLFRLENRLPPDVSLSATISQFGTSGDSDNDDKTDLAPAWRF
jgi:hypothetical protein